MIPAGARMAAVDLDTAMAADPVVQRYRAFFALFDWTQVPERDPHRPWPGSSPHPQAAYIKALLVKVCEGKRFITELRTFLVEHPLLVLDLGFRPGPDATQPGGIDVAATVPGARWLRQQQQTLAPGVLGALLQSTVTALATEVPNLGTTVAVDVKHLYAWVRENNPREHLPHRFDPARQPHGDPACRLGGKRVTKQAGAVAKEYLWGYGTGIVTTTHSCWGDVVLAEVTQPFNEADITYYHPLAQQPVAHLGHCPTNLAADAAFDAWHVYQTCAEHGGLAAIPRNRRGPAPARDAAGHPLCDRRLAMTPASQFVHEDGFRAQRYRCPLLWPAPTGEPCHHAQFAKGRGCTKYINFEAGGRMRAELDRQGAPYREIYRQRTSTERIFSQAKTLGIERPMVRTAAAVQRLNTLIYLVINGRALHRIRALKAAHAPPPMLC